MMTAALGTLPFIATLWLLAVLYAAILDESGAKIRAALKGERSNKAPSAVCRPPRREMPRPVVRRVIADLRAAA